MFWRSSDGVLLLLLHEMHFQPRCLKMGDTPTCWIFWETCRMTGVTLHSHVHYKEIPQKKRSSHLTRARSSLTSDLNQILGPIQCFDFFPAALFQPCSLIPRPSLNLGPRLDTLSLRSQTSSGSIPRSQTERGITSTDLSPGDGTGQAQRRILLNKFSHQ